MKPTTKGFLIGAVAGAVALALVEVFVVVVFGLFMALSGGTWLVSRTLQPPPLPAGDPPPALGEASYDWKLRDIDGHLHSFEEFRGRPVFVNVWATWCMPCLAEMDSIEKLHAATADEGVAFVLVSEESEATLRRFARQHTVTAPLYFADELPEEFATETFPTTYVVEADGSIVLRHAGSARWDDETCRRFLGAAARRAQVGS